MPTLVRIFISSPGDVQDERDRARFVVQQLRRTFAGRFELEAVLWEELPLQVDMSFQEGIDMVLSRKGVDIAVFILWSRLGSPTGPLMVGDRKRAFRSGTEREWHLMLQAREQCLLQGLPPKPAIIAYTRRDEESFEERLRGKPDELKTLEIEQKLAVTTFIAEEFKDTDSGVNLRAYHSFDQPTTFARQLRIHLANLLEMMAGEASEKLCWDPVDQGPPFRGLEVFEFEHSPIFFGREDEIVAIRSQLREQACRGCAFVLISGPSGSGKSSLARAGVLPDICAHEVDQNVAAWRWLAIRPSELGKDLLRGLLQKLSDQTVLPELRKWQKDLAIPDDRTDLRAWIACLSLRIKDALEGQHKRTARLVLLVDQLEELLAGNPAIASENHVFFEVLEALARSRNVWVVATVRSDFYAECQKIAALVRMKSGLGHFDLIPPGPDDLLRVVTGPATLAGLRFEQAGDDSLINSIMREAASRTELLPLVEHLLLDLYEHRTESGLLTLERYRELQGLQGALRQHCEKAFDKMPEATQKTFGQVFAQLVNLNGEDLDTAVRRTVTLQSFESDRDASDLVKRLIDERLLTTSVNLQGQSLVSVAHEAILRAWPRVSQWIEENRTFLALRANVEHAYGRWAEMTTNRESLLLPAGLPLEEGRKLRQTSSQLLTRDMNHFIIESIAYHDYASRRRRALRAIAFSALMILTLVSLTLAYFTSKNLYIAKESQHEAELATTEASTSRDALSETLASFYQDRGLRRPQIIRPLNSFSSRINYNFATSAEFKSVQGLFSQKPKSADASAASSDASNDQSPSHLWYASAAAISTRDKTRESQLTRFRLAIDERHFPRYALQLKTDPNSPAHLHFDASSKFLSILNGSLQITGEPWDRAWTINGLSGKVLDACWHPTQPLLFVVTDEPKLIIYDAATDRIVDSKALFGDLTRLTIQKQGQYIVAYGEGAYLIPINGSSLGTEHQMLRGKVAMVQIARDTPLFLLLTASGSIHSYKVDRSESTEIKIDSTSNLELDADAIFACPCGLHCMAHTRKREVCSFDAHTGSSKVLYNHQKTVDNQAVETHAGSFIIHSGGAPILLCEDGPLRLETNGPEHFICASDDQTTILLACNEILEFVPAITFRSLIMSKVLEWPEQHVKGLLAVVSRILPAGVNPMSFLMNENAKVRSNYHLKHTDRLIGATSQNSGTLIASLERSGLLRVWQEFRGAQEPYKEIAIPAETSASMSSSGKYIAIGGWTSERKSVRVRVHKAIDGAPASRWYNHDAYVNRAIFSPDDKQLLLLTANPDCLERRISAKLGLAKNEGRILRWNWDADKPQSDPIQTEAEPIDAAYVSPRHALVLLADGQTLILDVEKWKVLSKTSPAHPSTESVKEIHDRTHFLPKQHRIIAAGVSDGMEIWNSDTLERVQSIAMGAVVTHVCVTRDQEFVLTVAGLKVRVYRAGREFQQINEFSVSDKVTFVEECTDGLVAIGIGNVVERIDVKENGVPSFLAKIHEPSVCACYIPDKNCLMVATKYDVHLYDVSNGQELGVALTMSIQPPIVHSPATKNYGFLTNGDLYLFKSERLLDPVDLGDRLDGISVLDISTLLSCQKVDEDRSRLITPTEWLTHYQRFSTNAAKLSEGAFIFDSQYIRDRRMYVNVRQTPRCIWVNAADNLSQEGKIELAQDSDMRWIDFTAYLRAWLSDEKAKTNVELNFIRAMLSAAKGLPVAVVKELATEILKVEPFSPEWRFQDLLCELILHPDQNHYRRISELTKLNFDQSLEECLANECTEMSEYHSLCELAFGKLQNIRPTIGRPTTDGEMGQLLELFSVGINQFQTSACDIAAILTIHPFSSPSMKNHSEKLLAELQSTSDFRKFALFLGVLIRLEKLDIADRLYSQDPACQEIHKSSLVDSLDDSDSINISPACESWIWISMLNAKLGKYKEAWRLRDRAAKDLNKFFDLDRSRINMFSVRDIINLRRNYLLLNEATTLLRDNPDSYHHKIEENVRDVEALRGRVNANMKRKNYQAVLDDIERCVILNEKDSFWIAGRGYAHACMGNWELALKDYEKAIELGGNESLINLNMAFLLTVCPDSNLANLKNAQVALSKVDESEKNSSFYMATEACILAAKGDFDAAILLQEKALGSKAYAQDVHIDGGIRALERIEAWKRQEVWSPKQ